ncbi:zinc-dependent alcohol dehydrogenase [Aquipuribacter sp. MA13-6]|uniref:zinc-dependent alcohol dehydrogenase n=1 Tax=unclassified Aquipuribacter TaxID=2635084 RepID=UPI003EEDD964
MDSTRQHEPTLASPGTARSLWVERPGVTALREHRLPAPGPDDVLVRTRFSGLSRGTERAVLMGEVPPEHAARMRAPFQVGDLPGPVSYGYLAVGTVEVGPDALLGRDVFVLHPHHDRFVVPAAAVHPVPEVVPARRAVLAGTVETALNVVWDAGVTLGDRVAVVGAGTVGASVARLAAGVPGTSVDLVDPQRQRALTASVLGVGYRHPEELAGAEHVGTYDVVVHTSASAAGLALALRLAPDDGEVVEVSWFGTRSPTVPLGEDVHSRRVGIRPSQVGAVARVRRDRRSHGARLDLALRLLADPGFDHLLGEDVPFEDLPERLPALLGTTGTGASPGGAGAARGGDGRCAVVAYGA